MTDNREHNPDNPIEYVVGLMFSQSKNTVLLIEKQRPDWQKGLLNGIGGKIESNESSLDAMTREFEEETGISHDEWSPFLVMKGVGWKVNCYRSFSDKIYDHQQMTDERVMLVNIISLSNIARVSNLEWMVKLALDEGPFQSEVTYNRNW